MVWVQGCTFRCPGCFNPATHAPQGGYDSDTGSPATQILGLGSTIEELSVSGGEPLQQPEPLLDLLERVSHSHLSRLVFSGYSLPEIVDLPLGPAILRQIDLLIAGRYVASQHTGHQLLGSANQQIHFLTNRHIPPTWAT